MRVKVILNPYANRWRAGAQAGATADAFRAAGVQCDLVTTDGPRHGDALAEAVAVIAAGQTRLIDAGQVNERFFINNSAAAMEPMVTLENIKMKRLSGEVRYIVALLRALAKLKPWQMSLTWDGGGYEGPAYLLSVCNSPRTGGFMMAPGAVLDDGLLDMVFAPQVSKGQVIAILLKLMRGQHIHHPAVTFQRVTAIDLTSRPGTPLHSDGEIFAAAAEVVRYRVLPGRVRLLS